MNFYFAELKLWAAFSTQEPGPFDELSADQKWMLRQEIFLSIVGFFDKAGRRRIRKPGDRQRPGAESSIESTGE